MKIMDQLPVLGFPKNFIELFNEIPETMGLRQIAGQAGLPPPFLGHIGNFRPQPETAFQWSV
jgi:hypothetical protein